MSNINDFLEKYVATNQPQARYQIIKGRVTFGFNARGSDEYKFFPVINESGDEVRIKAASWAEQNGGDVDPKKNPAVAVALRRYQGTSYTKNTSLWDKPHLEYAQSKRVFGVETEVESDDGDLIRKLEWKVTPGFDILTASVSDVRSTWYDDIENVFPSELLGKDVWLVLRAKPDPTYDENDPETWNKYNSFDAQDGTTVRKYWDYVHAVFEDENELKQWMRDNNVEASGDYENKIESTHTFDPPDGFENDPEWQTVEWKDIFDEIANSLKKLVGKSAPLQKKGIDSIISSWDNPEWLSYEYLSSVLEKLSEEPPF